MSKKAEPDEPRGEVKRQPGARAYAAQAQRYLDEGDLDQALRICRAGFEGDPDFEEGALTYLRALALAKDLDTGAEVFATAARCSPRSATLRVAWARVLLDARRAEEARDLAREAIDIDPNDAEALELLASLGETAPGHRPASAPRAAALRAWVRPVGQRTSATSLFDLTTPPPTRDPRGTGKFMFDAPPTPLERTDEHEPPDAPVDPMSVTGERDLFPEYTDPGVRDPTAAPAPLPRRRERPAAAPRPAAEPPEESAIVPRPRQGRRWGVPLAVAVVLVAATVAGITTWRWYRDRQVARGVAAAVAVCDADTREAHLRAASALQQLATEHGASDPRIAGAQALVQAHLLTRFNHGQRAAVLARATAGQGNALALLAQALLEPVVDLKRLAAVDAQRGGWHLRLLRLRACTARGEPAACDRLFDAELRLPQPAPAVLAAGAALLRRRGETARAARLLARAREIAPAHVPAALEAALLELERGTVAPDELKRLASITEEVPAHRAKVTLLIAAAARAAGKPEGALALLKRASALAPDDVDVLWYSASWALGPGGDAGHALAALQGHRELLDRSWPDAPLLRAAALLRLGRPTAAREALAAAAAQGGDRVAHRDELAVRAAHAAGDAADVRTRCARPEALRVRVACVEALLEQGQLEQAQQLAAAVTEPADVKAYLAGLLALAAGEEPAAITALRQASKEPTERAGALQPAAPWLALGRAYAQRSRLTAALSAVRRGLALDANSVPARVAIAAVLVALGQDTEARAHLDEVLAAQPTAAGVLAAAGDELLTLGLVDKARTLIEGRVTRASPPAVRIIEGRVAIADGKLDRAAEIFRSVLDDHPRSAEAMIALGRVEAALNRRSQAQRLFAEALKLRPKEPQLLLLFAQTQAQLGRYRDALPVGIDAVRQFKEQGQSWRAVDALITLGRLFRRGDAWAVARAEELLFEAVKNKEAPAIAFLELGRVHRKLGDSKRQIWCLKQAIDRDPKLAIAHRDLGLALRGSRRTRKQALRALRTYLRLSPDAKDAPRIKALLKRR